MDEYRPELAEKACSTYPNVSAVRELEVLAVHVHRGGATNDGLPRRAPERAESEVEGLAVACQRPLGFEAVRSEEAVKLFSDARNDLPSVVSDIRGV